jgi:hypothetical protein
MKRKTIMMVLWLGTVATTVFADLGSPIPWDIDTRRLDDYHYFLYNGGHYVSLNFLMVAIGVLCVAFLAWRLRKDQCGTWFTTLKALLLILLRVVCLGLLGVLLLVVIGIWSTSGGSSPSLVVGIGVLCVAFLVWVLRNTDQCGTWIATLKALLLILLRVVCLGLLGVLLLFVIGIWIIGMGGNPIFYLDMPWNRAAYDRRCIECYESNGREGARPDGAVYRPFKPRTNAPAEVQEAYDRFIGTRWRKSEWFGPVKEEAQTMQTEQRHIKSAKKFMEH